MPKPKKKRRPKGNWGPYLSPKSGQTVPSGHTVASGQPAKVQVKSRTPVMDAVFARRAETNELGYTVEEVRAWRQKHYRGSYEPPAGIRRRPGFPQ